MYSPYFIIAELKVWDKNKFYFLDCMHKREGENLGFIGIDEKSLFLSVKPEISKFLADKNFLSDDFPIYKILENNKLIDCMLYFYLNASLYSTGINKRKFYEEKLYSTLEKILKKHYKNKIYFYYISLNKNWSNKKFILNVVDDDSLVKKECYSLEDFVGDILISFKPFHDHFNLPTIVARNIPAEEL